MNGLAAEHARLVQPDLTAEVGRQIRNSNSNGYVRLGERIFPCPLGGAATYVIPAVGSV